MSTMADVPDVEKNVTPPQGNVSEQDVSQQTTLEATNEEIAWEDPREKRNPTNWSMSKKLWHSVIPCLGAFVITVSTSVTVPATQYFALEWSLDRTTSLLPLTVYTIGIGFGPLIMAPFSELFGRRSVSIFSIGCLLLFTGAAGAVKTFGGLIACRFFAGFLGSAGVAIGGGSVADIWQGTKIAGIAALFFVLGPFLGPTLGPLAGAYILHDHGYKWQWTQWLILMITAPVFIGTILMSETSKTWILRDKSVKSSKSISKRAFEATKMILIATERPIQLLVTEPIVLVLTLYTAYAYAMIFSYFASSSYILTLDYGFNPRQVGLSFISVIIGYILAALVFGVFDRTLYVVAWNKANGLPAPEHRLYAAFVGSIFLPVGLFWYAWEAHQGGHWAALVASGIPFGLGAFSIFLSALTYMVDVYGSESSASALAANGTLRYTLGATFPLFTLQMYQNLGVHWAASVFAFLSLFLLPIPWLLFRFGKTLRNKSRKAQQQNDKIESS